MVCLIAKHAQFVLNETRQEKTPSLAFSLFLFVIMMRLASLVAAVAATAPSATKTQFLHVEPQKEPNTRDVLICNAYPGSKAKVERHGKAIATDLGFPGCQKFEKVELNQGDKLGFYLDNKAEGSFEITKLPEKNAMMLLVLEKKDTSTTKLAFQSYSFQAAAGESAQVAVIDTIKNAATKLTIEDKVSYDKDGKPAKNQRVRLEELDLNRVYSIDAGEYDADFKDDSTHKAKQNLKFAKGNNYVLIRAGDTKELQSMVVFPGDIAHSGAATLALGALVAMFF